MRNILRLPSQTVHPNDIPAVTFEPDVNIGLAGITACHNVEDAAFGRYHGEDTAVVGQKAGQSLTGTIIRKKTDFLHFLQIIEFTLQIEEFCFGFLVLRLPQLVPQAFDLPFQVLAILPVFPDLRTAHLIEILFVVVKETCHFPHNTGFTFSRCGNDHGVQTERFGIARCPLDQEFALQTDRQNTDPDNCRHVFGSLTVRRYRFHIVLHDLRKAVDRKGRKLTVLLFQREKRLERFRLRRRVYFAATLNGFLNRQGPIGISAMAFIPFRTHQF